MVKLLTGYTGVNIFAADDQDLYKGIVGSGSVVFNFGGKLGLTVTSSDNAVTATIADGAFSFNGRIVRVATAETRELTVPESGRYRKCEIVARYEKNSGTYIESVTLTPLYSSEDSDTASGAEALPISTTANDFPLYSFVYSSSGIEQGTKETLFTVTESIESLRQRIAETETGLTSEVTARGNADSALDSRLTTAESTLSTTTAKANASRIIEVHTKNGDGFDIVPGSRIIILQYRGDYNRLATAVVPNVNGNYDVIWAEWRGLGSGYTYKMDGVTVNNNRLTGGSSQLVSIVCVG